MPLQHFSKARSLKTAPSLVMKSLPILKDFTFKLGPLNVLMRD